MAAINVLDRFSFNSTLEPPAILQPGMVSPSLTRRIAHLFWSILGGLRSLTCSPIFSKEKFDSILMLIPKADDTNVPEADDTNPEADNTNVKGFLRQLNSRGGVDSRIFTETGLRNPTTKCITDDPSTFLVEDCLFNSYSLEGLENKIKEEKFIFIPVVLHYWPIDHIVCFKINVEEKTIEFFDSQGLSIRDRGDDLVRNGVNITLLDFANKIYQKCCYAPDPCQQRRWQFIENPVRRQKNIFDCGLHVAAFCQNRSLNDVDTDGLERRKIIDKVVDLMTKKNPLISEVESTPEPEPGNPNGDDFVV